MHIHLFPRPNADTGIGLHWCVGRSQLPIQQIRAFWIPQLRALGAAWIKLNDHRGALPLVEEFLAAGIQPIVRIYRPAPNPDPLGEAELAAVTGLVRAGVRYIEVSHRPDLPAQWRNGVLPPDAQALVARHLAQDLAEVLSRGGLPALPALDPSTGWDLIAELMRMGKRDILQGPIWQAVHNPGYNRPPDYPADLLHSEDAPFTQSYYLALAEEEWEGDAWRGRSLAEVNRLRRRAAASSPSPADKGDAPAESGGFFNFASLHARHMELLGRAIPILSTNGGYVVGAADDPRYPAITPSLHLAYTLEACRILMGSSTRSAPAPDYFFCASFWLLANQALESSQSARENDAWYSQEHPNGVLPIVPVLQAESKRLRHAPQVVRSEPPTLSVQSGDTFLSFTPAFPAGKSMITGKVRGGASVDLRLIDLESGFFLQTLSRANGDYRFVDLPAGRYSLWVEYPPGSRQSDIVVDGEQTVVIDLAVDGWGYEINERTDGASGMFQCTVAMTEDMAGAPSLRLRWPGGERVLAMVRSGRDRIARCTAGPLETGIYEVELLGLSDSAPGDLRAAVPVSRGAETHIHFLYSRVPGSRKPLAASAIEGKIVNGASAQVTLYHADGRKRSVRTDAAGAFRFPGLASGCYSLTVTGNGQTFSRTRLGVDGENFLLVGFELPIHTEPPPPAYAALWGNAPGQAGRAAILTSANGIVRTQRIDERARFRFESLSPGEYDLVAGDFQIVGLQLNDAERQTVVFPAPNAQWQVHMRTRPSLSHPGLVRVQVLGHKGVSVILSGEGMERQVRPTGSAPAYGLFAVEFGPLAPGDYLVEVEGADAGAAFALEGTEAVVIVFQRGGVLSGPPLIEYQSV